MVGKRKSKLRSIEHITGHESCLFLLKFDEIGDSHMEGVERTGPSGAGDTNQFQTCIFRRNPDEDLANGDQEAGKWPTYILKPGQFVLLKPNENGYRPGVGQIISLHVNSLKNIIRIRWFYRGEELDDIVRYQSTVVVPGEDEVFESDHIDHVDADSIAGRCVVTPYPEWLKKQTHFKSLTNPVEPEDGNDASLNELVSNDTDTDGSYILKDDYSVSSLHLYCRRFYDPKTRTVVVSTFENRKANPAAELASLRLPILTSTLPDNEADPTFTIACSGVGDDGLPPSDDDSANDAIVSEDERESLNGRAALDNDDEFDPISSRRQPSTQSQRKRRRQTTGRRRGRGGGMSSTFALPTELGENLLCRDSQKEHVRNFLLGVIHDPCGKRGDVNRCLYISGVPGTGKTATVRQVVRDLRAQRMTGELPPFKVLELNCMALPYPTAVYTELYAAVTGSRGVSAPHAAQLLEQRYMRSDLDGEDEFNGYGIEASTQSGDEDEREDANGNSSTRRKGRGKGRARGRARGTGTSKGDRSKTVSNKEDDGVIIVVLDEMDVLLARKQKVVYDLLEWPSRQNARIAMIGIANTMDLPERMLPRMGSRLGLNRLVYPPYTRDELMKIVRQTHSVSQIKDDALRLCASKVGGVSGDVRRALQLCRRALELSPEPPISAQHMQKAIRESTDDFRFCALAQLALLERVTLACIVVLSRSLLQFNDDDCATASLGGCSIERVSERAWDAIVHLDLAKDGFNPQRYIDFEDACFRLAKLRLVVIDKNLVKRLSRVILNVPVDDCSQALKDDCQTCRSILCEVAT